MLINAHTEIEKLTGIPSDESRRIFEEVKLNSARLENCAGPHDFEPHGDLRPFRRKWKCTKCEGVIDSIAKSWYDRGLRHGKL